MPLLAGDLLARVIAGRIDPNPPFSVLFTLWLSITQAVGPNPATLLRTGLCLCSPGVHRSMRRLRCDLWPHHDAQSSSSSGCSSSGAKLSPFAPHCSITKPSSSHRLVYSHSTVQSVSPGGA